MFQLFFYPIKKIVVKINKEGGGIRKKKGLLPYNGFRFCDLSSLFWIKALVFVSEIMPSGSFANKMSFINFEAFLVQ